MRRSNKLRSRLSKTRKNIKKVKGGSNAGNAVSYVNMCLPENGAPDQKIYYSSSDKNMNSLLGTCVNKNSQENVRFQIIDNNGNTIYKFYNMLANDFVYY